MLFALGTIGVVAELIHGAFVPRVVLYVVVLIAGTVGLMRKARRA